MSQKYSLYFIILACCALVDVESDLLNPLNGKQRPRPGNKVADDYQHHEPIQPSPAITKLAKSISDGLLNSDVLGSYAHFQIAHVHDLFFRVGSRLLEAAGIDAPDLAEIAANAGKEVGLVDSQLYFDTIGFMLAKFLYSTGILSHDNSDYLSIRIVSSIELVACFDGLYDTETTMNAVVYGFFDVLNKYGLINYKYMAKLFYLFAEEIEALAAKY